MIPDWKANSDEIACNFWNQVIVLLQKKVGSRFGGESRSKSGFYKYWETKIDSSTIVSSSKYVFSVTIVSARLRGQK